MYKNLKLVSQVFLLSILMVLFQNCTESEFSSEESFAVEDVQVFDGEQKDNSKEISTEPIGEIATEDEEESAVQEVVIELDGELERECAIKLKTDPARLSYYIKNPGDVQSKSFYLINSGIDRVAGLKITGFVFESGSEGKFRVNNFICNSLDPVSYTHLTLPTKA